MVKARATSGTASDSCGCAMGGRFVAVALVAAIGWYAWHWRTSSLSVWAMALRSLIWLFVVAIIGKAIGVLTLRRSVRRRSA